MCSFLVWVWFLLVFEPDCFSKFLSLPGCSELLRLARFAGGSELLCFPFSFFFFLVFSFFLSLCCLCCPQSLSLSLYLFFHSFLRGPVIPFRKGHVVMCPTEITTSNHNIVFQWDDDPYAEVVWSAGHFWCFSGPGVRVGGLGRASP